MLPAAILQPAAVACIRNRVQMKINPPDFQDDWSMKES